MTRQDRRDRSRLRGMTMPTPTIVEDPIGINGMGRIGKLTLWNHVARRFFGGVVV